MSHREEESMDFRDYPKELDLRDGTRVWLRQTVADDRVRIFEFFKCLSAKDRRYFKHDVSKRKTIDAWCDNLDYDLTLPILAVTRHGRGEKVVGSATLHAERHGWSTHVARIRVQILPDMRKRGLGQVLLREVCDRAAMRGIDKIQAHVRADNAAGLKLMRKLGFRKEGVFKDHVIARNGRRHDMVILYEDLEDLWRRMEDLNLDLDTPSLWP